MTTTPEPVRMTAEQDATFRAELARYREVQTDSLTSTAASLMPRPLPHCPRCGRQERSHIVFGGNRPTDPALITFAACGHRFLPPLPHEPLEA